MKTILANKRSTGMTLPGDLDPTKHTMKKVPVCTCGNTLMIRVRAFSKIQGVCYKCGKKYDVNNFKFQGDKEEESVWKNLE